MRPSSPIDAVGALVVGLLLACGGLPDATLEAPAPDAPAKPDPDEGLTRQSPTDVGRGVPRRVKLFDANATHAALQVIHDPWLTGEDFPAPVTCGYPGMKEWPQAGVTLALIELATGKAQVWPVYANATMADACTKETDASKLRGEAEAAMRAVGLDPARRPDPVASRTPEGFDIGGRRVEVREEHGLVEDYGRAIGQLVVDGRVIFTDQHGYSPSMASYREVDFADAYAVGDGYVFVEKVHDFSGRGGDSWVFTVTPVLRVR